MNRQGSRLARLSERRSICLFCSSRETFRSLFQQRRQHVSQNRHPYSRLRRVQIGHSADDLESANVSSRQPKFTKEHLADTHQDDSKRQPSAIDSRYVYTGTYPRRSFARPLFRSELRRQPFLHSMNLNGSRRSYSKTRAEVEGDAPHPKSKKRATPRKQAVTRSSKGRRLAGKARKTSPRKDLEVNTLCKQLEELATTKVPKLEAGDLARVDGQIREIQQRIDELRISQVSENNAKQARHQPQPKAAELAKTTLKGQNEVQSELIDASAESMKALPVSQPRVPSLSHGLERILFNPGVYQLQDPRSRVFNFDPYLQNIMPIGEFNFSALGQYVTSSQDSALYQIGKDHQKRYLGSTSSMSSALTHFHYLLSQWRPINTAMVSKGFPSESTQFTELSRGPSAIFLKHKDGMYAIDADKEFDSANILSMLGKSLEKLLTLDTKGYERYRKSSLDGVTEEEAAAPEAYHYSTFGDFLMRSQLDAHDPRLPGTGMFDLKTRAVVSIRMDVQNYEHGLGYQIKHQQGNYESYEREYHDMIRAAFLKYSMQVRMGRMDGIFVAFHNIEQIFGFQYISLNEMDFAIHGQADTCLGNQEFALSLKLLNTIFDKATHAFPDQTIRLHFETRPTAVPCMYIFAEPMTEDEVENIQSSRRNKIADFENSVLGLSPQPCAEAESAEATSSESCSEETDRAATALENEFLGEDEAESNIEPGQPFEVSDILDGQSLESALQRQGQAASDSVRGRRPKMTETPDKPLLAMVLTIKNVINDEEVQRPENLKRSDKWRVEHALSEVTDMRRAHTAYAACKQRRSRIFDRPPNPAEEENLSLYVRKLREMSRHGRAWADLQKARDRKRPVEIFKATAE